MMSPPFSIHKVLYFTLGVGFTVCRIVYCDESKEIPEIDEIYMDAYKIGNEVVTNTASDRKLLSTALHTTALTFDSDGYRLLLNNIKNHKNTDRFTQALSHPRFNRPHCDRGNWVDPYNGFGLGHLFPGGPFRNGNDLYGWFNTMLMNVRTPASANVPATTNMVMQGFEQVRGIIQSAISVLVDLVPPLVIGLPLPCLPMLTGRNCIGSVLYPISAADFVSADIIDSSMDGIISAFPGKYAAKVGYTSDFQYKICASAYLGMHCAGLFPICATGAAKVVETFPICFIQCLATLVACPGFWMEDIIDVCGGETSLPPFCSFSVFINYQRVPPQYTTYEASKLYPEGCPKYDPNLDMPLDLYDKKNIPHSKIADAAKEKLPIYEKLLKSLETSVSKIKPCDCEKMKNVCKLHSPYPVHVPSSLTESETHYQSPEHVSLEEKRCCNECKPIWEAIYSVH